MAPSATQPAPPSRRFRVRCTTVVVYGLLTVGAVAMLLPLWWMFILSVSTAGDASRAASGVAGIKLWESNPQWSNYAEALGRIGTRSTAASAGGESIALIEHYRGFLDALANSIVVTTLNVIGQVISCSLVGYGFARLRFRGREPMFILMLSTMMLPAQVTMIPMFLLFRKLGWVDTILPLVVPAFFGSAFFIFMFRQFFSQIPEALIEAARIDGAGHLGIWRQIMLPMCRPVIAIVAVFTFISTWNDFLYPLIYLHSEDQATLAVALNSFRNQYGGVTSVHLLMAASIVTMLPCILLFLVAQRQFVGGLTLGGVKG